MNCQDTLQENRGIARPGEKGYSHPLPLINMGDPHRGSGNEKKFKNT